MSNSRGAVHTALIQRGEEFVFKREIYEKATAYNWNGFASGESAINDAFNRAINKLDVNDCFLKASLKISEQTHPPKAPEKIVFDNQNLPAQASSRDATTTSPLLSMNLPNEKIIDSKSSKTQTLGRHWVLFHTGKANYKYYYDSESIVRTSKNNVLLWSKTVSSKEARDAFPSTAQEITRREEYDCSKPSRRILDIFKDGVRERISNEWRDIAPQSPTEILYEIVCKSRTIYNKDNRNAE
ncbi:MAG: hypothetical protein HPY67_04390 [Syntrophaceae bacterium]|nr:hypothetical protein [Syntrophaceae bacterium]